VSCGWLEELRGITSVELGLGDGGEVIFEVNDV
jgi:hypothetical protein